MAVQLICSDQTVKRESAAQSISSELSTGYDGPVEQQDRDLSEYVRARLRELIADGMEQKEIARRAGVSKSLVSMHLTKIGIGHRAAAKYARLLGFADLRALREAARSRERVELSPVQLEAMRVVVDLGQATELHARSVLEQLTIPRYADRTVAEWIQMLLLEVARDKAGAPVPPPLPPANETASRRARRA